MTHCDRHRELQLSLQEGSSFVDVTGKQIVEGRISRKRTADTSICRRTLPRDRHWKHLSAEFDRHQAAEPKARSCTQPAHSATGSRESADGSEIRSPLGLGRLGIHGSTGSIAEHYASRRRVFSVGKYAFQKKRDRSPLGSVTRRYLGVSPSFLVTHGLRFWPSNVPDLT